MSKYLTEQQIHAIIGDYKLPEGFATMSQDSYNEEQILTKIVQMKNPPELLACAINMAVVGFGNKRYGQYRSGDTIVNIPNVFRTYQISFSNDQHALLKEDDITPQRLCRVFRHKIRNFLLNNKQASYLWRKYSDRDENFRAVVFRGSEYLEDLKPQEADYLLSAVRNMDLKMQTTVADRIIRVFDARGQKFTRI